MTKDVGQSTFLNDDLVNLRSVQIVAPKIETYIDEQCRNLHDNEQLAHSLA